MTKLAILELIAGLIGWVWLLSGAAFLVFAGLAIFSDATWGNAITAIIVSAVAKWLAGGLNENLERLKIEHHARETFNEIIQERDNE